MSHGRHARLEYAWRSAPRGTVVALVLGEGMSLVGAGSAIGLVLAYIAVRLAAALRHN
jgi:hypothetical protein